MATFPMVGDLKMSGMTLKEAGKVLNTIYREKYSQVHDINRTGSMLDNIIYYNVKLERELFKPELLEELLSVAPGSVSEREGGIIFKHLIVQIRMTPLPKRLTRSGASSAPVRV